MNAVLLLSGGIESSTLLHELQGEAGLGALFIDYGQRAAAAERRAARTQCARLRVPMTELDMAAVGEAFRAQQTHKLHVPLPHRNLIVASLAVSFASEHKASAIYLALNVEDTQAYASASLAFVQHLQTLVHTLDDIAIRTPFIAETKAQVVARGIARGVDFAATYSCLLGHTQHCGSCPQCLKRQAAFAAAGASEPANFYRARI